MGHPSVFEKIPGLCGRSLREQGGSFDFAQDRLLRPSLHKTSYCRATLDRTAESRCPYTATPEPRGAPAEAQGSTREREGR
jgi:hypothetical protein